MGRSTNEIIRTLPHARLRRIERETVTIIEAYKLEIIKAVGNLRIEGYSVGEATEKVAKLRGISVRNVENIWRGRKTSQALAAIHEAMTDLRQADVIDAKTMREFDESCLK